MADFTRQNKGKEAPASGSSIEVKTTQEDEDEEEEEDVKPQLPHSDLSSRSSELSNFTPQEMARLRAEVGDEQVITGARNALQCVGARPTVS